MQILSLETVQQMVVHVGSEGLCASFKSVIDGETVEMMVQRPAGCGIGDPLPEHRDLSIVSRLDMSDRVVAAHTELGAIFLQMWEDGEL